MLVWKYILLMNQAFVSNFIKSLKATMPSHVNTSNKEKTILFLTEIKSLWRSPLDRYLLHATRHYIFLFLSRHTEVGYLYTIIVSDEAIASSQIAMYAVFGFQVTHTTSCVPTHRQQRPGVERRRSCSKESEQRTT